MKKKIILTIIVILLLILNFYLFFNLIYIRHKNKAFIEKYDIEIAKNIQNSNFKINKIILYSSASGKNKNTNFQRTDWLLDIFQYTDIAIYFEQPTYLNSSNTIKTLNISNIKYNVESTKYSPLVYYLDGNDFGTDKIIDKYKIEDNLEYTILNLDNKDNSILYNTPVFFSDLSNPITLKFTNTLFKNYSIKNTEKLIFDGSLLSKTPISLKNLDASISFNIDITNFENEKYYTNINIKMPIQNNTDNIFSGHILDTQNTNILFLKQ